MRVSTPIARGSVPATPLGARMRGGWGGGNVDAGWVGRGKRPCLVVHLRDDHLHLRASQDVRDADARDGDEHQLGIPVHLRLPDGWRRGAGSRQCRLAHPRCGDRRHLHPLLALGFPRHAARLDVADPAGQFRLRGAAAGRNGEVVQPKPRLGLHRLWRQSDDVGFIPDDAPASRQHARTERLDRCRQARRHRFGICRDVSVRSGDAPAERHMCRDIRPRRALPLSGAAGASLGTGFRPVAPAAISRTVAMPPFASSRALARRTPPPEAAAASSRPCRPAPRLS